MSQLNYETMKANYSKFIAKIGIKRKTRAREIVRVRALDS